MIKKSANKKLFQCYSVIKNLRNKGDHKKKLNNNPSFDTQMVQKSKYCK